MLIGLTLQLLHAYILILGNQFIIGLNFGFVPIVVFIIYRIRAIVSRFKGHVGVLLLDALSYVVYEKACLILTL